MTDDARGDDSPQPVPLRVMCPQCHNPHTIVGEQGHRGVIRFCPMCDHSWAVGQSSESGRVAEERTDEGPARRRP